MHCTTKQPKGSISSTADSTPQGSWYSKPLNMLHVTVRHCADADCDRMPCVLCVVDHKQQATSSPPLNFTTFEPSLKFTGCSHKTHPRTLLSAVDPVAISKCDPSRACNPDIVSTFMEYCLQTAGNRYASPPLWASQPVMCCLSKRSLSCTRYCP